MKKMMIFAAVILIAIISLTVVNAIFDLFSFFKELHGF